MNSRSRNLLLIALAVVGAAIAGAFVARSLGPAGQPQPEQTEQRRPIIEIARQQPGLPSLADAVAGLCPAIAAVMPAGSSGGAVPAFAVSSDGWVLTSAVALPGGDLEAHFGSDEALAISELRTDPVSGLAILKTAADGLTPLPITDQPFPRVGDFGFAIMDPAAAGCSAQVAMVASDFVTDGGAPNAYVRLQPMGPDLRPGTPLVSGTGQLIGVVAPGGPANAVIPADVIGDIADELIRGSLSPTTGFGFRAEDFDAALSARLSNGRATGTAVALVQPKSPAARAGLQAGDVVVGVNGSPVASASELGRALDGAGRTAAIDLVRGNQRLTLTVARVPGS